MSADDLPEWFPLSDPKGGIHAGGSTFGGWRLEKARIGSCVARRALRRLVRGLHPRSFILGILAGVLVGRL